MSTHRTPDDRLAQMEALATDPDADWDTLHWIAENYPSLRPAVAENPGTYPELLEALAAMNDPEIDAALARRDAAAQESAELTEEPTGEVPLAPAEEPGPAFLEQRLDAPDPEEAEGPAPESYEEFEHAEPEPEPEPEPAHAAAPAYAEASAYDQPEYAPSTAQEEASAERPDALPGQAPRRSSRTPKLVAAVLLPVIGMIAVGILIFALLGDSGEQVAVEPAPAPAQEAPEENGGEEPQEETEQEGPDPAAQLEEARAELLALPEGSACQDPAEDAAPVAAFIAAAAEADGVSGETQTVEDMFSDLQDACDPVHAAAVYESVRSGGEEEVSGSFEAVGTGWVDPLMSADGAQEMESFVTPDNNIRCVFEDGVTCTVQEQTGRAPAGCEDGATFSMQVDGGTPGLDCENEVSPEDDHQTLAHDSTATDGFLACVSLDDRISCWNTLTGVGFEMSERDHYAYSP